MVSTPVVTLNNSAKKTAFNWSQPIRECVLITSVLPFCSGDLDLDPETMTLDLDLDILKTYLHTKMKFVGQCFQNLELKHDTETRFCSYDLDLDIDQWSW